jgi:hypothetical protein
VHTAMIIVLALFAVLLAVSAGGKLVRNEMQMATLRKGDRAIGSAVMMPALAVVAMAIVTA